MSERPMNPVQTNPNILGGIPCFTGTRVPVDSLFEHLRQGYTLDEYLSDFPSVKREYAEAVLDFAARNVPIQALKAAG